MILGIDVPEGAVVALLVAGLSWMAFMAKQGMETAKANQQTAVIVSSLEVRHEKLREDFDAYVAARQEEYISRLKAEIATLKGKDDEGGNPTRVRS